MDQIDRVPLAEGPIERLGFYCSWKRIAMGLSDDDIRTSNIYPLCAACPGRGNDKKLCGHYTPLSEREFFGRP